MERGGKLKDLVYSSSLSNLFQCFDMTRPTLVSPLSDFGKSFLGNISSTATPSFKFSRRFHWRAGGGGGGTYYSD